LLVTFASLAVGFAASAFVLALALMVSLRQGCASPPPWEDPLAMALLIASPFVGLTVAAALFSLKQLARQ
jgi:TRAP-type C4-dicarboxylate transport system permease small subunit